MFRLAVHEHIALPDDGAFYVQSEGRVATIYCRTRSGSRIFSYSGEDYGWLCGKVTTQDVTLVSGSGDRSIPFRHMRYVDDRDAFTAGTIDLVRYRLVDLSVEIGDRSVIANTETFSEIKHWAARTLRTFINWYRYVTVGIDVAMPRMADSPFIEVWYASEGAITRDGITAQFNLVARELNWLPLAGQSQLKQNAKHDQIVQLERLMESGEPVPLHIEITLDARERSHRNGDYGLSIVLIGTAFEVFLRRRLLGKCDRLQLTRLPSHPTSDYREVIEDGNVRKTFLKEVAPFLAGGSVVSNSEHQRWYDRAYVPRNEIVHTGRRGRSAADAEAAFNAVNEYIDYLDRRLR
jgi:hypothetical protein